MNEELDFEQVAKIKVIGVGGGGNNAVNRYGIGKPEKNPMFLEKRVYQGSSGVVYPYPVIAQSMLLNLSSIS